ncbi:hypothetical protein ILUMI_13161 [Ignelater luminosus]|uniref:Uncharacterized protein n=1 Tax=Ignelater luminosus TaxID=2038154 RepID=A0A8K0D1C3_IGNLU|nr:hypothetical protein ILUMI_13161 [Ignelater luminosus]
MLASKSSPMSSSLSQKNVNQNYEPLEYAFLSDDDMNLNDSTETVTRYAWQGVVKKRKRNITKAVPNKSTGLESDGHNISTGSGRKNTSYSYNSQQRGEDLEPDKNNKSIYNIQFLGHCKVLVELPRKKTDIMQCIRCQEYGHSKTYCNKPYTSNCVKCGKPHDSKICKKTRDSPAICALYNGNHFANYKGYSDLVTLRTKGNKSAQNRAAQRLPVNATINQQQIIPGFRQDSMEDKLANFLAEFKNMFSQLLNQNSMILACLQHTKIEEAVSYLTTLLQAAAWEATPSTQALPDSRNIPLYIKDLVQEKCSDEEYSRQNSSKSTCSQTP